MGGHIYLLTARAVDRKGYTGFCRGGIKWPSNGDRIECVTQRLLDLVKAERNVSIMDIAKVDTIPDGMELRDVPEPTYVDHAARAVDDARKLDAEAAGLQAQIDLEAKRARNAKLREDLAATKALADEAEAKKSGDLPKTVDSKPKK